MAVAWQQTCLDAPPETEWTDTGIATALYSKFGHCFQSTFAEIEDNQKLEEIKFQALPISGSINQSETLNQEQKNTNE